MPRWTWLLVALALAGLAAGALALRASLDSEPGAAAPPAMIPADRTPDVTAAPPSDAAPAPSNPGAEGRDAGLTTATEAPIERARVILRAVDERDGAPLPGYVGGRSFRNREGRLPPGRYWEYDLHPYRPGRDRGPERLVVDQTTGKAYFTRDHYRSFVPLR